MLLPLSSCSSGSSSSTQTVFAQTAYSNASLTGTYSIEFYSSGGYLMFQGGTSQFDGIGTIIANGAGGLTGGTISINSGNDSCQYSVAGTYSIQSTALGTATLNLSLTSKTGTCPSAPTLQLSLAAAQQGESILFAASTSATSGQSFAGTATKQ
jgi:hypothetical protein